MKYTAVVTIKVDIEVEADDDKEARVKAHEQAFIFMSDGLDGNIEGFTIGTPEITKIQ